MMSQRLIIEEGPYLERTAQRDYINIPRRKYALTLVWSGFTPTVTGGDTAELPVPPRPDGLLADWRICRFVVHVAVAGGSPSVVLEYSRTADTAEWLKVAEALLQAGQKTAVGTSNEVVKSGGYLRFNVLALGTATGWTVSVDLEELPK